MSTAPRFAGAVLTALALVLLAPLALTGEEQEDADAGDRTARAKEAWEKNCTKCHAVPDARYETDRAFLRQITETT